MQLVIDANIFISAFLKSALTRELLLDDIIELFAPEYFSMEITEVTQRAAFLKKLKGLAKSDVQELSTNLLSHINILPEEEYSHFIEKAGQEVPADDAPYLALSLALKIPVWSNDAAFKKQTLVTTYTTTEVAKLVSRC